MLPILPNRKMRASLYVPHDNELPQGEPIAKVFNFVLGPLEAAELSLNVLRPLVIWGVTANSASVAGFRAQMFHTHGNEQRQMFQSALPGALFAGTAQLPRLLRESTYLLNAGDVVTIAVSNLEAVAASTAVQVVLFGVQPQ